MIKAMINGRPSGSEQGILTAILHYLVVLGTNPVHHRNTGIIIGRNGVNLRFGRGRNAINQRGAPDILVTYKGRGMAIEVKNATGRLRPEQRDWLDRFQKGASAGLVVVARSVDDVVNAVDKINAGETWQLDLAPVAHH